MAFKLRVAKGERSLSFYDSSVVSAQATLAGAPGPDWGVAAVTAGDLRQLGFDVRSDPLGMDELGRAHVAATPAEVGSDGQIPTDLGALLAARAFWVIEPRR